MDFRDIGKGASALHKIRDLGRRLKKPPLIWFRKSPIISISSRCRPDGLMPSWREFPRDRSQDGSPHPREYSHAGVMGA